MKNKLLFLIAFIGIAFLISGCGNSGKDDEYLSGKHYVEMSVKDVGIVKMELDADVAPISVTNFIGLVEDGFYDGLTFHRIIENFMIQGGAPKDSESASKLKTIKGEFSANGVKNDIDHVRGVISMARTDEMDSASSQFFIVHEDSPHLNGQYAAFGHVTEGMDVVDELAENTPVVDDNGMVAEVNQPVIEYIKVIEANKDLNR